MENNKKNRELIINFASDEDGEYKITISKEECKELAEVFSQIHSLLE